MGWQNQEKVIAYQENERGRLDQGEREKVMACNWKER